MENEKETVELNENQLEAVAGAGEDVQWKIIGYCPDCKGYKLYKCSMYPGEGPFDCPVCQTQLTDVRVEEY